MASDPVAFMVITFVILVIWGLFICWLTTGVLHKKFAKNCVSYSLFHLTDPSNALNVSPAFKMYGCTYYVISYNGMLNTLEGITRSGNTVERLRKEVEALQKESVDVDDQAL